MVAAAVAGTVVQTGFVFAPSRSRFDISHLSPLAGMTRLFSLRSIVELAKSIAKVAVVGIVVAVAMRGEIERLSLAATLTPEQTVGAIARLILHLLMGVLAVLTVLAGADYFYQRFSFLRSLRMCRSARSRRR